jgi:predicted nucleotidyltransferase
MKFVRYNPSLLFENSQPATPVEQLDEIDQLASSIDDHLGQELHVPNDVLDSFKIKDTLSTDIWPDGNLAPKIRKQLIKVAKDFIDGLEIDKDIEIKDIIFTGSLANYNWSKFSDIDLHIIVSYNDLESDPSLTKDYFWSSKNLWNQKHDITVFDYPVEIYVQDVKEKLVATAVYSILHDKWIKKPKREEFKLNKKTIKDKADNFIIQLKDIKTAYNKEEYQEVVDIVTNLKAKIKNMRKSGLERGGELSDENIVFKVLRRTPFMEILDSYKAKAYDKLMSVMETLNEDDRWNKDGVVFIRGQALPDNEQRLFVTTTKNILNLNRKKKGDSAGIPAEMISFGNNPVYRVGLVDGRLKPLKVAWKSNTSMLQRLGLIKTSLVLNSNTKTPLHWKSLKYNNVITAINNLSQELQALPNIKWIN